MPPRCHLDGPGVGAGDRRLGLQLVRNALRLGSGHKALEHHGLMFGPRAMTGPAPQTILPYFVLSMPG